MTSTEPYREELIGAPDAPDARVLALDIGVYGHRGSVSSMFWYQAGDQLHTHVAELLPDDATVLDQLDVLEAIAETYEEYWRISPVVVVGVTVLSHVGKQQVRAHLDSWYNPPWRRRLVSIGDYAGEHGSTGRGIITRKKLRDLVAQRLTDHTITLTADQHDAVSTYTGRRLKPSHDSDDEWRADETDAMALPIALSCLAVPALLPTPVQSAEQRHRITRRAQRAWQLEWGLDDDAAYEQAMRRGHPRHALQPDQPADAPQAPMKRPTVPARRARPRRSRRVQDR